MKKRSLLLIGSAGNCPDLEYASGFRAVDAVAFLLTRDGRHLVVPDMEVGRALHSAHKTQVWTPAELGLRKKQKGGALLWASRLMKNLNIRTITVSPQFPHGAAKQLEKNGARVLVSHEELFPERAIKSAEECRKIAESQQAAVIAMRAALMALAEADVDAGGFLQRGRQRVTSDWVRAVINHTLLDHNCMCDETIVAGGAQGADPHERGHGELKAHAPIVIDIFPRHLVHGYWGDLTRTVVRGRASPLVRRMYGAVRAAQAAALNHLRPGVKGSTVHAAAAAEMDRRGFPRRTVDGRAVGFIHSTGHGVGLAVHEAPSLGVNDVRLRAGHVVTVEPGLYYPETGGVRIEDTVVITRDGWRYLVPCEKKLEI
jgi:Xaa-Pro aminopeptidase